MVLYDFFTAHAQDTDEQMANWIRPMLENDSRFAQVCKDTGDSDVENCAKVFARYMVSEVRYGNFLDNPAWQNASPAEQMRELLMSWLFWLYYRGGDGLDDTETAVWLARVIYTTYKD